MIADRYGLACAAGIAGTLVLGAATLLALNGEPPKETKTTTVQPAEDPMMEAMVKAGTPGDHHHELAGLIGSWDCEVKWWMDPASQPQISKGTSEVVSKYGGRYIHMKYSGEGMAPGETMEGEGIFGYDNSSGKHFATWIDSMGTGMAYATGSCDDKTKVLTLTGEMVCPINNKKCQFKEVWTKVNPDKYVFSWYDNSMTDEMVRGMEITYSRRK